MKFRSRLAALLAVLAIASPLPNAAADNWQADITRFSTRDVTVTSQGCKNVPVTMAVWEDPAVWYTDITTHIYRGYEEVDYTWFSPNEPDLWQWCHFMGGFGRFRLGPSDVTTDTDNGSYTDEDFTYGWVKVKAGSRSSLTSAVRTGRTVKLTAKVTAYVYDRAAFRPWAQANVVFQHRLAGSAVWRSLPPVTTNSDGVATRSVSMTRRYWRAVASEALLRFGSTSGQLLR